MRKKTIGILGGMGPEGTADLYLKIVKYYQDHFGAKYDKDFPRMILYSVPVPDVVESLENEKETLIMLSETAQILEKAGCDFIVIACNTVQYLLEDIRKAVQIPILGIAEINTEYVKGKGYSKVGILSTQATIDKKVYEQDLEKTGIAIIKPSPKEQKIVTEVIMRQLAGKTTKNDTEKLVRVVNDLKEAGAEAILIACTDLPPVISQDDVEIPLIDCTKVYADKAARLSHS